MGGMLRQPSSPDVQLEVYNPNSKTNLSTKKKKQKGLPYRSANRAKVRDQIQSEFLGRQMRSMQRM